MGYNLHRAIAEALGPEITAAQRLVALQIALDARDPDAPRREDDNRAPGESRISLARLAELTGAKNEKVVRTLLNQLATAGWNFRVPLRGRGSDGRMLYAVEGKALNFRVPARQEPVKPVKPRSRAKEATIVASSGEKRPKETSVVSQATSVRSEATIVASQTTLVGPYVLPSTSDLPPSSFDASRSQASATPPLANEGRKDDSTKEEQKQARQRAAWEIIGRFGLSEANGAERSAFMTKIAAKLAEGHTSAAIYNELNRGTLDGVGSRVAVLSSRLERLGAPQRAHADRQRGPEARSVAEALALAQEGGKDAATGSSSPPAAVLLPLFDREADGRRRDAEKQRRADEREKAQRALEELREYRARIGFDAVG